MTGRLEEALRRVASLSPSEQDAIAFQIMETLDARESEAVHDERGWTREDLYTRGRSD